MHLEAGDQRGLRVQQYGMFDAQPRGESSGVGLGLGRVRRGRVAMGAATGPTWSTFSLHISSFLWLWPVSCPRGGFSPTQQSPVAGSVLDLAAVEHGLAKIGIAHGLVGLQPTGLGHGAIHFV